MLSPYYQHHSHIFLIAYFHLVLFLTNWKWLVLYQYIKKNKDSRF
jgi:hypothetical protein